MFRVARTRRFTTMRKPYPCSLPFCAFCSCFCCASSISTYFLYVSALTIVAYRCSFQASIYSPYSTTTFLASSRNSSASSSVGSSLSLFSKKLFKPLPLLLSKRICYSNPHNTSKLLYQSIPVLPINNIFS